MLEGGELQLQGIIKPHARPIGLYSLPWERCLHTSYGLGAG
jgi:hypothetical protein